MKVLVEVLKDAPVNWLCMYEEKISGSADL